MAFEALQGTLTRDEGIVLVTLARALVRADGQVSDQELTTIVSLARAVGLDVFADALDRPESGPLSRPALLALADRVTEGHRVLVLEALWELGAADGLVAPERDLIGELARRWQVEEPTLR